MRLSQAPVSRLRYPCVSTWLEGLFCAWLFFASRKRQEQARERKRLRLFAISLLSQSSHVRSSFFVRCAVGLGVPLWTSPYSSSPESPPSRSLCACRWRSPWKKLGKRSDRSLGASLRNRAKRPTVDAYAQVSASPQHRDKSTTIHGSDIQIQRRGDGWEEYTSSYCPCCMRKRSCACLGWELFVVMIVTGSNTRARSSSPPNTEVVPNEF
jgi:hypothetical protein